MKLAVTKSIINRLVGNAQALRKTTIALVLINICFFQTVVFVSDTLAQSPAPAPATKTDEPVDIQASQQEFQEDQILAHGNVKVTYKDSIVTGPEAQLFRDANGQAQRALFTGHPFLTQNDSKINADTLVFEIANSKVIAQGHAHSEVISSGEEDNGGGAGANNKKSGSVNSAGKTATNGPAAQKSSGSAHVASSGTPKINWPHDGDEDESNQPDNASTTEDSSSKPKAESVASESSAKSEKPKSSGASEPVEKIITDADYQEYVKQDGKFEATGHVHVIHVDVSVYADKVRLVYGLDGKPETALFTGNVNATQKTNHTLSDLLTYYLKTRRLQATGHVRSKVIQKKPEEKPKAASPKIISSNPTGTAGGAQAANASKGNQPNKNKPETEPIIVASDAQDYSRDSGVMKADGNVHLYYEDTVGFGPKAILLNNEEGKADKVIFLGRSQISQTGKRWIADRITFTVATKKVLAEGNSKALITNSSGPSKDGGSNSAKPENNEDKTNIASAEFDKVAASSTYSVSDGTQISASKIETPK